MQVYVVTTCDWEMGTAEVRGVYLNRADADARAAELDAEDLYDVVDVSLQTVHQGAAIAA